MPITEQTKSDIIRTALRELSRSQARIADLPLANFMSFIEAASIEAYNAAESEILSELPEAVHTVTKPQEVVDVLNALGVEASVRVSVNGDIYIDVPEQRVSVTFASGETHA